MSHRKSSKHFVAIVQVPSLRTILAQKDHEPYLDKLTNQTEFLYTLINTSNEHFWPALINPVEHISAPVEGYAYGDKSHMQLALKCIFPAWAETPGAMELIAALYEQRVGHEKQESIRHCEGDSTL